MLVDHPQTLGRPRGTPCTVSDGVVLVALRADAPALLDAWRDTVADADRSLMVVTLSRGPSPVVAVDGDRVTVGWPVARFNSEKLTLGRWG